MRAFFLSFLLLINAGFLSAQQSKTSDVFAFRITDYTVPINDSTTLVQIVVKQPDLGLENGQYAALKGNYSNKDTLYLGAGKCNLVKGDYYYFGIFLLNKKRQPLPNDLLYTYLDFKPVYKGQLYNLIKNDIYLQQVTEGAFYNFSFAVSGNEIQEKAILDSLVADVKYTGNEMLSQGDGQDRLIAAGRFKNKQLFAAMKTITKNDIADFLDYVIARPGIYAGNDWKIAEVFATWMNEGAPTVVKNSAVN